LPFARSYAEPLLRQLNQKIGPPIHPAAQLPQCPNIT
jgi:hypothetical protein